MVFLHYFHIFEIHIHTPENYKKNFSDDKIFNLNELYQMILCFLSKYMHKLFVL